MRRFFLVVLAGAATLGAYVAWRHIRPAARELVPGSAAIGPRMTAPDSPATTAAGPKPPTAADGPGRLHFEDVTASSGISFRHTSGDYSEKPFPAANGSGLAAFDYDLDGIVDLLFLTGNRTTFDQQWKELAFNRLYRGLGDMRFHDVTAPSGLGHDGYSAGVAVGDFDGDGFADVFVNCYGPDRFYWNQGDGTFADISESTGVAADDLWGTSCAFLDYDADGLLDLYVCNYGRWSMATNRYCGDPSRGVRTFCSPTSIEPAPAVLWHNEGNGSLRDAASEAGLNQRLGRGQGVVAADFNDDGMIDLYVANDLHPNFMFMNLGGGRFGDQTELSGAARDYQGGEQAGMGIGLADANRDGLPDLFVTNYEGEHNAYYENLGMFQFQEISRARGLAAESIPWVGWGTALADFDLDGWADCIVTNGHTDNNFREIGRDSPYDQPPGLWRNVRGRFQFCGGGQAGAYFSGTHVGRGLVTADLDGDGDLDVVVLHQDASPAVLKNLCLERAEPGSITWLALQLRGRQSNRDAVGAQVRVPGIEPVMTALVAGGGSYASASHLTLVLGLPAGLRAIDVQVRWPSGAVSTHGALETNSRHAVHEPRPRD